jgi:phosphatidate phosphatase APP1
MYRAVSVLRNTRNFFRRISFSLKVNLGWLDIPTIVPFMGYSNGTDTYIHGEVVEYMGIAKPVEGQSKWENLLAMIKRYLADEFPGVEVEVEFAGLKQIAVTNKFGVFNCHFQHNSTPLSSSVWQKAYFKLAKIIHPEQNILPVEGEVMVVKNNMQFGIISDIDDTIMVSYATNRFMKLRLMLMNNAFTRMPFEGVSAFYRSLQLGSKLNVYNPLFYLSNSEWNLYDLLHEFIEFNRIPKGPMLLREMAIHVLRPWKIREYNRYHKLEKLRHLLTVYSNLKFILIGDSGQRDPLVYSQIVKEFPGRIQAIYIRDVGLKRKTIRVQTLSKTLNSKYQTEMVLVKDTESASKHALSRGYIKSQQLKSIHDENQKDIEKSSS